MAEKTLVDVFTELLGSLTDEQRRAMQEALQKGAALIQGIVAAEGARKPERLPSPAQPADIPDMRGRRP